MTTVLRTAELDVEAATPDEAKERAIAEVYRGDLCDKESVIGMDADIHDDQYM